MPFDLGSISICIHKRNYGHSGNNFFTLYSLYSMLALRFSDYSMVIHARDDPAPTVPPPDMRMPLSDHWCLQPCCTRLSLLCLSIIPPARFSVTTKPSCCWDFSKDLINSFAKNIKDLFRESLNQLNWEGLTEQDQNGVDDILICREFNPLNPPNRTRSKLDSSKSLC